MKWEGRDRGLNWEEGKGNLSSGRFPLPAHTCIRDSRWFFRAGATGTAMAVPVFEEEKWRCWDSDLRAHS